MGTRVFGLQQRTKNAKSAIVVVTAALTVLLCVSSCVNGFVIAPNHPRGVPRIIPWGGDRSAASENLFHSSRSSDGNSWEDTQVVWPEEEEEEEEEKELVANVTILEQGPHHMVVAKPPGVVCHHGGRVGSRSRKKKNMEQDDEEAEEIPMLQRVRDALGGKRHVNLVHRLDRGASGCLLFTFADDPTTTATTTNITNDDPLFESTDHEKNNNNNEEEEEEERGDNDKKEKGATAALIEAMSLSTATKTYVALVRGEGVLRGENLTARGWFAVDRPIKDERGVERNSTTYFNFLAGQDNGGLLNLNATKARASLVLARPQTGRWHQVRRHLNGLSHPILGDTTHGSSQTNREWKETRNMPGERTCLHLAHLFLPPNNTTQPFCPNGINVQCGIPNDMIEMMRLELPDIWPQAERLLSEQGISLTPPPTSTFQVLPVFREKKSVKLLPAAVQEDETRILTQGEHFVVVEKPPSVVCHFSKWSNKQPTNGSVEPTAMLQRVRDATGRSVNLVHRLDRGASGCLLLAFCDRIKNNSESESVGAAATSALMDSMKRPETIKTYVAIVVGGNGTTNENEDLIKRGWFTVNQTVMDSHGRPKQAVTDIRFLAGTTSQDATTTGVKAALVLARPHTGRWHQIRQHLSSSACGYHPIMGDTTHGLARTNREWKEMRGLPKERTCLHLARLQLPPTIPFMPNGLDESCPLPADMMSILQNHLPGVFERAMTILEEEGVQLL